MASPTQTVIGKGSPNPLIAEGLLKILWDLVSSFPPNLLPILFHRMVGPQKYLNSFVKRNELGLVTLTVNLRQAELPDPQWILSS